MRYYRIQTTDYDPAELLEDGQVSTSWSNDSTRSGKSVCTSREALATYLAQSGIPFGSGSWVLVELEGYGSDDEDEDAHLGALLIHPTKIVSVEPIEDSFFDEIDAAAEAIYA